MTIHTRGFAAHSATEELVPFSFERREPLSKDVVIDILYCGICHSDIHFVKNDWGMTQYPIVPGHEIVGRINSVGTEVTKFKIGDLVGVGCIVDSCGHCSSCKESEEHHCENGYTMTFGSEDKKSGTRHKLTLGGYSEKLTIDENYVLRIPDNLDLASAAPLLCAGITTYSPLKKWGVKPGQKIGVIGLGGLGHIAVKFAHAMGAKVVMITTSPEKGADAKKLGADEVLLSKDDAAMAAAANSFDFLLNTIPVGHDVNPYLWLLKRDCTMVIVGSFEALTAVSGIPLILKRTSLSGSVIGGIAETQEMLDFCGTHNITCDIEKIGFDYVNQAYDRTVKGDVKYRFVLDIASLNRDE